MDALVVSFRSGLLWRDACLAWCCYGVVSASARYHWRAAHVNAAGHSSEHPSRRLAASIGAHFAVRWQEKAGDDARMGARG